MRDGIEIIVDGRALRVEPGVTVAAALLGAGHVTFRRSTLGESRAPVCGMGVCYECRVSIDGAPQRRACMTLVHAGMRVDTDAGPS